MEFLYRDHYGMKQKKTDGRLVNMALLKAILYELQPIDLMHSEININNYIKEQSITQILSQLKHTVDYICDKIPVMMNLVRNRSRKEWMILTGCIIYWKTVVFLHQALDAGPSIIIITLLIAIFTFGLGDNDAANNGNEERVSAYSVFNRGFRNIMGGVDANALINQHVGGGFFVNNRDDDADVDRHDEGRHRQPLQQQAGQRQNRQEDRQQEPPPQEQQQQPPNRSRKSNKKNRRMRNIEQRREMQQQRDAAAAMGFVGGGGGDENNNDHINLNLQQQDRMAMNLLLDNQHRDESDGD